MEMRDSLASFLHMAGRELSVTAKGDQTTDDDRWSIGVTTNDDWVTYVDEVILALTLLGSGSILMMMFVREYNGRPATTRMRIVQSLVLSDFMLGVVGLIGTSIALRYGTLVQGTDTCDGLGFSIVAILWTEHAWTLVLAIATYMILIYPLSPATLWLERRWYWLWLVVWVFAVVISIIGYEVFGFFPNGGICYYGTNSAIYGELIQFIPRAFVMLVITVLYARLFVFLRRPDRIRASFSDHDNHKMYGAQPKSNVYLQRAVTFASIAKKRRESRQLERRMSRAGADPNNNLRRMNTKIPIPSVQAKDFAQYTSDGGQLSPGSVASPPVGLQSPFLQGGETPSNGLDRRMTTPPSTPEEMDVNNGGGGGVTQVPAPWEQVQLPIFHVDGEKFGGYTGGSNLQRDDTKNSIWSSWRGLGSSNNNNSNNRGERKRQNTVTSNSSNSVNSSPKIKASGRVNSFSTVRDYGTPSSIQAPTFSPLPEVDSPDEKTPTQAFFGNKNATSASRAGTDLRDSMEEDRDRFGFKRSDSSDLLTKKLEQIQTRKKSVVSTSSTNGPIREEPETYSENGNEHSVTQEEEEDEDSDPTCVSSSDPRQSESNRTNSTISSTPNNSGTLSTSTTKPLINRNKTPPKILCTTENNDDSEIETPIVTPNPPFPIHAPTSPSLKPPSAQTRTLTGRLSGDAEIGEEEEEEDDADDFDLMQMLSGPRNNGVATDGNRNGQSGSTGDGHIEEFVEESMASYLNRKTALLMLWFPIGYCVLFSVSLIRIIYDFVGIPPIGLRAVSRWFIFSQGILDALIYGLVEWHTKRAVRKRVRKGTFNTPAVSRSQNSMGGRIGGFGPFGGRGSKARASASQIDPVSSLLMSCTNGSPPGATSSRLSNGNGNGTGSFGFVDHNGHGIEPRSIHQTLTEKEKDAKEKEKEKEAENGYVSHGHIEKKNGTERKGSDISGLNPVIEEIRDEKDEKRRKE